MANDVEITDAQLQNARNWITCATEHPFEARKEEAVRLIAEGLQSLTTIADLRKKLEGMVGLRKLIHHLERHNQWFERCESGWCNPSDDWNPANGIFLAAKTKAAGGAE